jgi:predicted nucleic acid-binding Zn ribbon protein
MKAKIKYPKAKCTYCGKPYTKTHNRQQYCSTKCRNNARKEQVNRAWRKWYHKNKKRLYQTQLGTRSIGPKPNPDPQREEQIIKNEVERIGLNKKFSN